MKEGHYMLISRKAIVVGLACVFALFPPPAEAQYMFLDVNSDGLNTTADDLQGRGNKYVDIWVQTDTGRDGRVTDLRDAIGTKPSINSYTFILRATDGTVRWGKYENLQPTMTFAFGSRQNATDYFTGYGGRESLPAGKYRLGRLYLTVESGSPRIEIVSKTSLWADARTSFGSSCLGTDGDNTLKLRGTGASAEPEGRKGQGDWGDVAGVAVRTGSLAFEPHRGSKAGLRFDVRWSRSPAATGGSIIFRTTQSGFARVRLFNSSGRLVKTLLDEPSIDSGEHIVGIRSHAAGSSLASGVYFYKVDVSEGTRSGRIVVLSR